MKSKCVADVQQYALMIKFVTQKYYIQTQVFTHFGYCIFSFSVLDLI